MTIKQLFKVLKKESEIHSLSFGSHSKSEKFTSYAQFVKYLKRVFIPEFAPAVLSADFIRNGNCFTAYINNGYNTISIYIH